MKCLIILFLTLFLLFSYTSYAQTDFETYRRQQQSQFNQFRQNENRQFTRYKDSLNRVYKQYRDSCYQALKRFRDSLNVEFGRQLKQKWQKSKPLPSIRPDGFQGFNTLLSYRRGLLPASASSTLKKNFYGIPLDFDIPKEILFHLKGATEEAIGEAWLHLNKCDLSELIIGCQLIAKDRQLNSWGYYQMICWLSEKIFPDQAHNEKVIFHYFMLTQSGYKCRIGYAADKRLTLLLPFNALIFFRNYQQFNDTPYYIMEKQLANDTISIYALDFPKASLITDIYLHKSPRFGNDNTEYKIYRCLDGDFQIKLPINKYLIDFYTTYPFCQLNVYHQTSPSSQLAQAVNEQFSSYLNVTDTTEKVVRLLKFMHSAFQYKTDEECWGDERYFFPEESLYYPYIDCEDYAILFCFLNRILIHSPAILVAYPKHVASAVRMRQDITKGYILHNKQKYTLCDPSYKGSIAGEVVPAVKDASPRVIE